MKPGKSSNQFKQALQPKQLYFMLVGLCLLFLVLGLFGYFWLAHKLGQKSQDLARVSAQVVLANQQIDSLKALEADYQRVQPLAAEVQRVLPPQKDQAEVVAQIAAIVQSNRLSLAGLSFDTTQGLPSDRSQTQPATGVSGIFVMPVRFQTTGSYHQIESLLKDFESEQRFIRTATLEITRTDNGRLEANFKVEVFFKP